MIKHERNSQEIDAMAEAISTSYAVPDGFDEASFEAEPGSKPWAQYELRSMSQIKGPHRAWT